MQQQTLVISPRLVISVMFILMLLLSSAIHALIAENYPWCVLFCAIAVGLLWQFKNFLPQDEE